MVLAYREEPAHKRYVDDIANTIGTETTTNTANENRVIPWVTVKCGRTLSLGCQHRTGKRRALGHD